jgi:hypothetical protein
MLFAATAAAQQQEQRMIDRLLKPDPTRVSPLAEKSFETRLYTGQQFDGVREYDGVKQAQTKEHATREFLGIRNPWFGKKVYATQAALELNRYVLADRAYPVRDFETRAAAEDGEEAVIVQKIDRTQPTPFLGRGKSQEQLDKAYPQGQPLTIEEVRELLNRNK